MKEFFSKKAVWIPCLIIFVVGLFWFLFSSDDKDTTYGVSRIKIQKIIDETPKNLPIRELQLDTLIEAGVKYHESAYRDLWIKIILPANSDLELKKYSTKSTLQIIDDRGRVYLDDETNPKIDIKTTKYLLLRSPISEYVDVVFSYTKR